MPILDDINEKLRDFVAFNSQNPLPTGDPTSGVFNPSKRDLRDLLLLIAQTQGDPEALQEILTELEGKADVSALQDALTSITVTAEASRSRANHTGTQAISTVTGLAAALDAQDSQLNELDVRRPLWPHIRPGDAPGLFTTDPNAAPATAPYVTDTVSTASGRVARVSGAGVVATRDLQAVELGRTYKARYVAQRNVNPTDPAGDAVTVGAVWYNRFGARISATVVNTLILTVGDGRQELVATFGVADGDFDWPAGAAYARPFVQAFGSDGVTYVEIIDWLDVTDATLWSPDVSEFASRIGAVESWSAGDRLDILEAEVGTPSTMRFLTEAAAAAASIPAGIEVLDIIGTGLLRRDPSGLSLTTADGAQWQWIADTVSFTSFAEIMSSPAAGYAAGTVLVALAENVSYEVLSIGAPGVHYITSGGVRLRALGGIVLLAAGQSNIESTSVHAAGGDLTPDPRIRVWSAGAGVFVVWDPAAGVPVGMASAGRNFVLFQAAKEALRNGVPAVYCINDGHAGDAIAQWVGSGTSSPNFQSLQTAINNAFASPELTSQGIETVSAMIWGQGESDGSGTFSLSYYRTSFETLKTQLRALSRFPSSTPITVLEMPPQPSAAVTNAYIMNALPYDDDPWTSVTRTKGLLIGGDNLHWTGAAMNDIGRRAWARLAEKSGDSLQSPYRLTTPFFKVRFDPVFGKGLGVTYNATDDRMDFGSSSDAAGDTLPQRFFGLRIAGNEMEVYQNVRLFNGLGLMTHGNPDFLNAAHAVNTSPSKRAGVVRWNAANNSLMVATGSGATAPWAQIPSSSLVTPT